ncbi:MAG: hypothetical protein KatS3mg011_1491 [Acidimicrobiia bacterium]|jgi:DNA-binding response OmpR family regulator|nr:MAG: hypothetical protein KatS3mg011_1491 [Acidimicrobiia bacterium]
MPRLLLVADDRWVVNDVLAAVDSNTTVDVLDDPSRVVETAARGDYDVIVVDMQVKSMGAMAVTRLVKDAAAVGELKPVPVVNLLDRRADVFLARRGGADAWVVKPFTAQEFRAVLEDLPAPAGHGA